MSQRTLNPYDTGNRCEAKPWISYDTEVCEAFPAENFGKVDFDDDCGDTVCVVYVERGDDGRHIVHVESLCPDDEIVVEVSMESRTVRIDEHGSANVAASSLERSHTEDVD